MEIHWWQDGTQPEEAIKFKYAWEAYHDGESGIEEVYCLTRLSFYRLLNMWNRITYDRKYWSAD